MRYLLLSLFVTIGVNCTNTTVYVCDSPNATRYHLVKNCRGLSNCSRRIITMPVEEAKKKNLTLCKWER